ncbi:MAG TPA: hypothetical protein VGX68_01955 [Thermoanaerobaculia bacterium]|jgi:hypothetical protein|nr:hypothetical protein [Thermoanaerobaculia bacterium]
MPPLRVHPVNPRYFQDAAGRAVYLTGCHHWDSLIDNGERPGGFDFERYLDRLEAWGHNFIRLWTHEAWTYDLQPRPYLRMGARFDLTRFDPQFFERLRQRVVRAGERGFYVSVMLFNGWSIHDNGEGNPWDRHPFNRRNNVNDIDGDPDGRGDGADVHTLRVPAVTRLQEVYAAKVVETVGDLDHVLWEISNESPGASRDWQYHLIHHLRSLDAGRHLVGMTACFPGNRNEDLFRSPADWISPGNSRGLQRSWQRDPPPADGAKVVLVDTDHLWGIGGGRDWVWKTFLRGHHPIYMDPLDDDPERQEARRAMGDTLRFAKRIDLASCVPDTKISSAGYALVNRTPGAEEILAYLPRGKAKVDLFDIEGTLHVEWFDAANGMSSDGGPIAGKGKLRFIAPWNREAVLLLTRSPSPAPLERGPGGEVSRATGR